MKEDLNYVFIVC